jgi:hypothetical protein
MFQFHVINVNKHHSIITAIISMMLDKNQSESNDRFILTSNTVRY